MGTSVCSVYILKLARHLGNIPASADDHGVTKA